MTKDKTKDDIAVGKIEQLECRAEARQSMRDALDNEYRKGAKFGFFVALIGLVLFIAGTSE